MSVYPIRNAASYMVACPYCFAVVGEACINMRAPSQRTVRPHPHRVWEATKAASGLFPHECLADDCAQIVLADDEPYCPVHSPVLDGLARHGWITNGAKLPWWSARRAASEAAS